MYTERKFMGCRWILPAWVLTSLCYGGTITADVLEPVVSGAVFENAPFDGIGDQFDPGSGRLIGNVNGTRQSVVMEFDISSLSPSFVNNSTFNARIVPNNSADTGIRAYKMFVYSGNGVIELSDYNAAGIEIGSVAHASGGSSNVNLDMAYAFQNILNQGASHLGIRIETVNEPQGWDVVTSPFPSPIHIQALFTPLNPGITNGGFQAGDLTGWQTYTTDEGNISSGLPRVELFDVTGDSQTSNAVKFRVGHNNPDGISTAGGGISQTFLLPTSGDYGVSIDVASFNGDFTGNTAPGKYELIMDGTVLDTLNFNGSVISPGQTIRGTLQADLANVSPGVHALQVQVTRPSLNSRIIYHYFDNISVTSLLIEGDLNGDGFVGIADLGLVLGAWNSNVSPGELLLGDPTGDGFVGIADLNTVLGNWNASAPPAAETIASIPEPGSLALLLVMGVSASHRRR